MVIRKSRALILLVEDDLDIQEFFSEMSDHEEYLESEVENYIDEKTL
jgi:hypothetical protein